MGLGQILNLSWVMSFLTDGLYVRGHRFGMERPNGFVPVAISTSDPCLYQYYSGRKRTNCIFGFHFFIQTMCNRVERGDSILTSYDSIPSGLDGNRPASESNLNYLFLTSHSPLIHYFLNFKQEMFGN